MKKTFHHDRYGVMTVRATPHGVVLHFRELLDILKVPRIADLGDAYAPENILSTFENDPYVGNREALPWVRECVLRVSEEARVREAFFRPSSTTVNIL